MIGSLNLMDYSLLLGIYDPNNRDNPSRTADNAGRHEHKEHRELQESQGRNANTLTKPRGKHISCDSLSLSLCVSVYVVCYL